MFVLNFLTHLKSHLCRHMEIDSEDIFGNALLDYHNGNPKGELITHSTLGGTDTLPLPYLFRSYTEMPQIEQKALQSAYGKILDVGCGAGSHSIWLQHNDKTVTAMDISAGAIAVCKSRGIYQVIQEAFLTFEGETFDTILLLMNGIGLARSLKALPSFLEHAKKLLRVGGQILLDSSDVIYLYETDDDGGVWVPGDVDYYGEAQFQMEYNGQMTPPFGWLYIDFNRLKEQAEIVGLDCELVMLGDHYDYLAKLCPSK
ncbi:MAG: class I SAM-dependent methyltransferase [Bacteroidota bacterium]